MKQALKKILPLAFVQRAVTLKNRLMLGMTPMRPFSEKLLCPLLEKKTLDAIFADAERECSWIETYRKISGVCGLEATWGGVNPGDRRALYYLVHAFKPHHLLEIGTHIGASTVFLAEALKNTSPDARMATVDILDVNDPQGPWKKLGLAMPPRQYLERLGSSGIVRFHASSSSVFLKSTGEKFDFIFLDGDHSSRTVYEEVSIALNILNPNGVILLHDYYPGGGPLFKDGNVIAGPFMAVDRIMRENNKIKVLPLGSLPWVTKQGQHATSLALLMRTV